MGSKSSDISMMGFTGKEYAAALSLVSLAILGSPSESNFPVSSDEIDFTQPTRRSKRIACRACTSYHGRFDTDEWIPNLVEEMEDCSIWNPKPDVAMGVPCVWTAVGYTDPCCMCKETGSIKKVTDSASSASDSAKSDTYAHPKI